MDDRTEWVVALVRREVDFILRFKRKFVKKRPKLKALKFEEVASVPRAELKEPGEKALFQNAMCSYRIANKLFDAEEYRDAYLYLQLSLEHLLKYAFAKSKRAYHRRYLDSLPSSADRGGRELDMSHDVTFMIKFFLELIVDIPTATRIRDLLSPLALAGISHEWALQRYISDPSDPSKQNEFKEHYLELRKTFLPFVVDMRRGGMFR